MTNKDINLDLFTIKNNKRVYSYLLSSGVSFNVTNSYYRGRPSYNSYTIIGDSPLEAIAKAFGIKDDNLKLFDALNQAMTNKEHNRIMRMNSSSLCSLLHFYKIDKVHPLTITLPDVGKVIFDKVKFEWENECVDINHPSCIDAMLFGHSVDTNEPIMLGLESKAFEYLYQTKSIKVKNAYLTDKVARTIYNPSTLKELDLKIIDGDDKCFKLTSSNYSSNYYSGIKQILSHYIGCINLVNGNSNREEIPGEYKNAKVYLGSIVLDCGFGELDTYHKLYSGVSTKVQLVLGPNNPRLILLPNLLTYNEVFKNYPLDSKVRQYYYHK